MKLSSRKTFLYIPAIICSLLLTSCVMQRPTFYVKTRLDNNIVTKRYPLNLAFVVDKELLNYIYSYHHGGLQFDIPLGRSLPIYYKEVLDAHFADVELVSEINSDSLGDIDLLTEISIDQCNVESNSTFFYTPELTISLTFSIDDVTSQNIISRTISMSRSESLQNPANMNSFKSVLGPIPSDKIKKQHLPFYKQEYTICKLFSEVFNKSLTKFSFEISGIPLFSSLDFEDINELVKHFIDAPTPLSVFSYSKMSDMFHEQTAKMKRRSAKDNDSIDDTDFSGPQTDTESKIKDRDIKDFIIESFINELNLILQGENLYEDERFKDIVLSKETWDLLRQNPEGEMLIRLNRLLLEDAYPKQIKKFDFSVSETIKNFNPENPGQPVSIEKWAETKRVDYDTSYVESKSKDSVKAVEGQDKLVAERQIQEEKDKLIAEEKERLLAEERRLQEEKEKKLQAKWSNWQNNLQSVYDEVQENDKDADLSTEEKMKEWKNILENYMEDNPYSKEDDVILKHAMQRLNYWENYKEPKPAIVKVPVTIHEELEPDSTSSINLRSVYNKKLPVSQLHELPHIAIRSSEKWGFLGHSTITRNYEMKSINGEKVVIDHATGLMWHQSGTDNSMRWKKDSQWIEDLNGRGYAGYQDWRLPTVEEAASLLESDKKNGDLYVDTVFDKKQSVIRTGDSKGMAGAWCWFVRFNEGSVRWKTIGTSDYYIRPVRSLNGESKSVIEKPLATVQKEEEKAEQPHTEAQHVSLRLYHDKLSVSQIHALPYMTMRSKETWGFAGYGTIQHEYEEKEISGEKVVIDHATGLMWHQSGSSDNMKLKSAKKWIKDLNSRGYAGCNDWRLPTVEEASTLLESDKRNGDLYVDPIFDKKQSVIRTGDSKGMAGAWCWFVRFNEGSVRWKTIGTSDYYIRPVRLIDRKHISLRSSYKDLSVWNVQSLPHILVRKNIKEGFDGHSTINHDYERVSKNAHKVIIDHTTGLMWHQSGSRVYMNVDEAEKWINDLNSKNYCGHNDWRLPTVEEAASLLEPRKNKYALYISPMFKKKQKWICTADSRGEDGRWRVFFDKGLVYWSSVKDVQDYIRPVRSIK